MILYTQKQYNSKHSYRIIIGKFQIKMLLSSVFLSLQVLLTTLIMQKMTTILTLDVKLIEIVKNMTSLILPH